MNPIKKMCCLGAAFAVLLAFAIPAHAQLALSYKLDVRASGTEQTEIVVSPCAGFNWVTAIGACGRELLSRVAHAGRTDNLAVFEPATVPSVSELPDLGRSERWQRMGVSNSGNSKTADLLFRFGSKLRQRGNEDGTSEWYRFSDTTYDSYVKQNGHKTVGVELHVPFQ